MSYLDGVAHRPRVCYRRSFESHSLTPLMIIVRFVKVLYKASPKSVQLRDWAGNGSWDGVEVIMPNLLK